MLANVGQFIPKNQLLFIATDEKNKSFFDPFYKRFSKIRYLDDYMIDADLKHINPNFLGKIYGFYLRFMCILVEFFEIFTIY